MPDWIIRQKRAIALVIGVTALIGLGIVMLMSTCYFADTGETGASEADLYFNVKRQMLWLGVGIAVCVVLAIFDYSKLASVKVAWWFMGIAAALLGLCFLPAVGERINGAARWISLKSLGFGEVRFQPSELAKLATIVFLAAWFSTYAGASRQFKMGFLYPLLGLLALTVLIGLEVDLGSAALLVAVALVVMFVAGSHWFYLGVTTTAGAVTLAVCIRMMPNRFERYLAFLDLEKYKLSYGLQQYRSRLAFGVGGVEGVGLGDGRQKMAYLPFAHTDFIFPMVGEELGLWMTLLVVFAYVVICVCGFLIALSAKDRFGQLLGVGIASLISAQAVVNMGVTTALLPNKGLPLPFVSYGGSNLVCLLAGVGILLSICRRAPAKHDPRRTLITQPKVTPKGI